MQNDYIPRVARIEHIFQETPDVKTFFLKYPLDFTPGQFLEVTCFGLGEAPISISSSPDEEFLKISFKRIGCVTKGLFNLKEKDYLGIRGPFGKGFSLEQLEQKELVFIAGGIGIAPLRSLLKFVLSQKRNKIANVTLLYGARTSADLLYKKELENWKESIKVLLTVDKPGIGWKGKVGVVVKLLDEIELDPAKTRAFVCGPEIMMHFAVTRLIELDIPPSEIILSLERHMKCGIGKCGHCYIADKFVCRDGPVFTYAQLRDLIPAEIL